MAENGEKPIKNMKGLLKFCMEATRNEDAPPSNCEEMPAEKSQWLEEALSSMSVNPVQRMAECLKFIEEAEVDTEEGTDSQVTSLMEIEGWVQDLDNAVDFVKIDGLKVVPGLLKSEVSEVRWRCLELLATLCQNNPSVQYAVLSRHIFPSILKMVDSDVNPTVQVKALYALSCIARSNDEGQKQLLANNGLTILAKAMTSKEEKMRTKSIFMVSAMCRSTFQCGLKDALLDQGVIKQMVAILKGEHNNSHEHVMSTLMSLVTSHAASKAYCLLDDFDLKSFLVKRIHFLEGKEDYEEERDYATQLLASLNTPSSHKPLSSSSTLAMLPA